MTRIFRSRFKKYIIGLLQQKRAFGYDYSKEERYLEKFDSFCVDYCPTESSLTKKIALKWAEVGGNNENPKACRHINSIRELAKYMNSIGVDSYVLPGDMLPSKSRFVPHLYTPEELSAIFSALDQLSPTKKSPIKHLVIPVMFRMIYCCGLRPGEGRDILRSNIDLKTGEIVILNSKNHKDRVVVLSADMLKLCRQYDKKIDAIFPDRSYFFPTRTGKAYSYSGARGIYWQCLKNTGMSFSGSTPRTYDLRHTFATNVLFRWMKEGKDVNAYLPYLSVYLGHEQFSHTAYYIHLVPQHFAQISDMYLSKHSHLIPEIENEN